MVGTNDAHRIKMSREIIATKEGKAIIGICPFCLARNKVNFSIYGTAEVSGCAHYQELSAMGTVDVMEFVRV